MQHSCVLKRNLIISSPTIKSQAYKSLVRPQLEYASTVWNPTTKKGSSTIEIVQRRAAHWVCNRYHNTSSVTNMLNHLQSHTLEMRRTDASLIMMYKITHDLVAMAILDCLGVLRVKLGAHTHTAIPKYRQTGTATGYHSFHTPSSGGMHCPLM